MLFRLVYLGVSNTFVLLRLLVVSDRDKTVEILALRHQIAVLERQLGEARPRFCPCPCRKSHPSRSGGMFVLVEDAAEALASSYVEVGYLVRICDWLGRRVQRAGVGDALVRAVSIVELLELA
jgi:hypothetical protein